MDASRFDSLARTLHARSRRRVLGSLSGLALGGALAPLLGLDIGEAKKGKKGKKGKKRKKKNKRKTNPTSPPPVTRADAQCVAEPIGGLPRSGGERIAQTFVPLSSGQLTAAQMRFQNNGVSGNYLLHLAAATAAGPTDTILATAQLPAAGLGGDFAMHQFDFANPATVTAGTLYALILTYPTSSFTPETTSNNCVGEAYYSGPPPQPYERLAPADHDFIFATFVRS